MKPLDIDRAISCIRGISLFDDQIGIFGGDELPEVVDGGVPVGSLYVKNDGTLWTKKEGTPLPLWKPFLTEVEFSSHIPVTLEGGEVVDVPIINGVLTIVLEDDTTIELNL